MPATNMTAQSMNITGMVAYANGRGYPYDLAAALDGGSDPIFAEEFDTPTLQAPWYDITNAHDASGGTYSYTWQDTETLADPGGSARRAFDATDVIDFTCDAMGNSGFAATNGDHLFYFKLSEASPYGRLGQINVADNNAFTFYVQPDAAGQIHIDWRLSDDGTWASATTVGAPSFYAGVMRSIRVVAIMNTAGQADGILKVWVDGTLYIDLEDLVFRLNASEQFGQFIIAPYIQSTAGIRTYTVDNIALDSTYALTVQAPTAIGLSNSSVADTAGTNAVVGAFNVTDSDVGDTHTVALVAGTGDTDNGLFTVSGNNLLINNAAAAGLGAKAIRVQATDEAGLTFSQQLTITVAVSGVTGTLVSMNFPGIAGAGRVAQFVDYSELAGTGTHTFSVARTHGTTGAITVDYATVGDAHTSVSGTLSWATGELDIKTVDVPISQANIDAVAGDHRIRFVLSNPTGGAVLHYGTSYTYANGIVDTAKVATDAVFYDAAAGTGGTGLTAGSPLNSIHVAVALLNSSGRKYLYGKGTTVIDTTYQPNISGGTSTYCIAAPAARSSEATRCYVQNWPGFTWTIDGNSGSVNNRAGFFADSDEAYCTYRGIDFQNLDAAAATANGFAIYYDDPNGGAAIDIELCTAININGVANTMAFGLWTTDGYKVWRCSGDNITKSDVGSGGASTTNGNNALFLTYKGVNGSVQRCEGTDMGKVMYHKDATAGQASTSMRFCIDNSSYGADYGAQGGGSDQHSFTIVQCNLFLPWTGSSTFQHTAINYKPGHGGSANTGEDQWWCNNTFVGKGAGSHGALDLKYEFKAKIFNNIFDDCRMVFSEQSADHPVAATKLTLLTNNVDYIPGGGLARSTVRYSWAAVEVADIAALDVLSGTGVNQATTNPLFTNPGTGDYSLQGGSPARTGGVDGTQQGAYLVDSIKLGAAA